MAPFFVSSEQVPNLGDVVVGALWSGRYMAAGAGSLWVVERMVLVERASSFMPARLSFWVRPHSFPDSLGSGISAADDEGFAGDPLGVA